MRTIKQLLLPGEQALFVASIHPVIYLRGMAYLAVAYFLWRHGWSLLSWWPWIAQLAMKTMYYLPALQHTRVTLSVLFGVFGLSAVAQAYLISTTTELVVTNERIIAKQGVTTITTLEMERYKIAGITVVQSMLGRVLDYGQVWIRGFSGDIHGLPAISQPRALQAAINR